MVVGDRVKYTKSKIPNTGVILEFTVDEEFVKILNSLGNIDFKAVGQISKNR